MDGDDDEALLFQPQPFDLHPSNQWPRNIAWIAIGIAIGVLGLLSIEVLFETKGLHTGSLPKEFVPKNSFSPSHESQPQPRDPSHSPSRSLSSRPSSSMTASHVHVSSSNLPLSPISSPKPSTLVPSPTIASAVKTYPVSPKGCLLAPCDELDPHVCSSGCDCQWDKEMKVCVVMQGQMRIGPQAPIPVEPVWDGSFDTMPQPLPRGFAGEPLPHAKGKFAYVTMISPFVYSSSGDRRQYSCLGLALFTSIRNTNPDPSIDFVLVILLSDDDSRFNDRSVTEDDIPLMLGPGMFEAFRTVGVKKFVLWHELDTEGKSMAGSWKQAFSKLKMWTLVDYERILFLDADKLVFRNLDHLFHEDGEFVAPGDWNCRNAKAALFPSGGFWVLRPSLKVFAVIEKYIAGPDPCGEKWYQGDQMIPRLLFTDISEVTSANNMLSLRHRSPEQIARWDGDVQMFLGADISRRVGRCGTTVLFDSHPSHRVDVVITADSQVYIPPASTWKILNMSYDMTVGVCGDSAFVQDDRFNLASSSDGSWSRTDAFSVHMSCYHVKPPCRRQKSIMTEAPKCLRDIFDRFYGYLDQYDINKLLAGSEHDDLANTMRGGLQPYSVE